MEESASRARERGLQAEPGSPGIEPPAADLSPREAARQTGLSRTLIYREIERGHLRAYKVGGKLRVTPDALAEWKRLHAVLPRSTAPAYERAAAAPAAGGSDSFASELRAIRQDRAA
jgi:excisionase family DNA binding protein